MSENLQDMYDQFTLWYRDDYSRTLWEDDNEQKLSHLSIEEKTKLFLSEYKKPKETDVRKLMKTSLWNYFIEDIGNPSYIDGI